ncbi:MAG: hypothetical protein ACREMR_07285 [Gemmatimonadales bacterium]
MKATTLLLVATITAACAGGASGASETPAPSGDHDRNVITEQELRATQGSTLYDVIRALRPEWLRRNPAMVRPEAEGDIVVYMDRARMGGPNSLAQIRPNAVAMVRHYSASEAAGEFGPGHIYGAIAVTTRP